MIELQNVSFSFKDEKVLSDINIRINDSEFIGVIGSNGAGKTTLIRLILGILKPTSGKVIRTDKKISYVSQTTSLNDSSFPSSVEEIVGLGLATNRPFIFDYKKNKKIIEDTMKEVGIYDIRKKLVSELSGGQLQKVKIAKALVSSPTIFVLDEPDAGMDEKSHQKLIETINQLHSDKKMTVIFISHHMDDLNNADNIFLVENGIVHSVKEGEKHVSI
ncbi:MAG: ATP-binding cassette domain-containing protein [Bacilli bacterium]